METKQRLKKCLIILLVCIPLLTLHGQEQIQTGLKYWEELKTLKEAVFKKEGDSKYCGSYHFAKNHTFLMKTSMALDDYSNHKQARVFKRFKKRMRVFVNKAETEFKGYKNESEFQSSKKQDTIISGLIQIQLYLDELSGQFTRGQATANDPDCVKARQRMLELSTQIKQQLSNLKK